MPALVADTCFILEPQLCLLVWMGCGYCGDPISNPPQAHWRAHRSAPQPVADTRA